MKSLPIPRDAKSAELSTEVLRVWVVDGGLRCSIAPWVWKEEPEMWGVLLADAARHMAAALEQELGEDRDRYLNLIRTTLESEWSRAWGGYEGDFIEKKNQKRRAEQGG